MKPFTYHPIRSIILGFKVLPLTDIQCTVFLDFFCASYTTSFISSTFPLRHRSWRSSNGSQSFALKAEKILTAMLRE